MSESSAFYLSAFAAVNSCLQNSDFLEQHFLEADQVDTLYKKNEHILKEHAATTKIFNLNLGIVIAAIRTVGQMYGESCE